MPPTHLPVANSLPSVWTTEPHPLDDYQSTPTLPSETDILIIGSGFSGVATAHHIFSSFTSSSSTTTTSGTNTTQPPKTVILEARAHCSGATGRNGGHLKPGPYYTAPRNARQYGDAAAAELAQWEINQLFAVKAFVEREGLDCDFHLTRSVDVYLERHQAEETLREYRDSLARGLVDGRDIAVTEGKDAERISGVKGAVCCFSHTAAHLFPKKLVQQLLRRLLDRGLLSYAHTPATHISTSRDSEGFWTVSTAERGDIRARKIVFATNAYTSAILPQYADKIVPVRGVCSHITTPGGVNDAPHLPSTYCLRFGGASYDYLIPRADGSIIVGGARQAFLHRREEWFDCVRDDQMTTDADAYFDGYMQRLFKGWEESGARIEKVWTGIMGYSSDFIPHIGAVPDAPGQFILAGFSGHGMPQIWLASEAVARMVLDDGLTYERTGLPAVLKTTKERLTAQGSLLEDSFRYLWVDDDNGRGRGVERIGEGEIMNTKLGDEEEEMRSVL